MATRDVSIRVSVDDKDATARLDALKKKLDELTKKIWTIRVRLDDGGAKAKIDAMSAKLDKMSKQTITPKFDMRGVTAANLQVDKLNAKLDELSHKRVTADVHVRTTGGRGSFLSRLFGGGGGSLGKDVAGAAGAAGGSGSGGILSALAGANNSTMGGAIAALIAYAMSIAPAIIPFGLGGLVGGGGALLAGRLGASGLAKLQGDRAALAQARAAIAGKGPTTPSQALALRQAQRQFNLDQSKFGGFVPFGHAVQGLEKSGLGALLTAVTGKGPGFSAGPHGQPGGSFLQGLLPIFTQLGHFVTSIGPALGGLFRAALPSLGAFVKIGEQFAKAILPAMTASLKALGPSLPTIVQGFKLLSQGIAGFITNLGPGMKDAAIIFKGSMVVVKGILQAVGVAASAFAIAIVKTAEFVRAVARDIPRYFDKMRHAIASTFDAVRHAIASAWDAVYQNTIARVGRAVQAVINWDGRLRHDIASAYDSIRHTIASTWDAVYNATIGKVVSLVSKVVSWFQGLPGKIKGAMSSLPGILGSIAKSALGAFLSGLETVGSTILGYIGHLASSIAGALASAIPGGGLISGALSFAGKYIHMANGGIISEPIVGHGLRSGATYTFGEGGLHEEVRPLGSSGGGGGTTNVYVSVNGDTNPDAAALRIVQLVRGYKQRHGNAALGIG